VTENQGIAIELNDPVHRDPWRTGWNCYGRVDKPDGVTYHVRLNYGFEVTSMPWFFRVTRLGKLFTEKAVLEVWKYERLKGNGLMGRHEYASNAVARAEFEKVVKMFREEP